MKKIGLFVMMALCLAATAHRPALAAVDDKWNAGTPGAAVSRDNQFRVEKTVQYARAVHAAIGASTQVVVTASYQTVVSTGGPVPVTATPSIKTTLPSGRAVPSGTIMILRGTSDANKVILQDDDSIAGTKLELGAATRDLGFNDLLELIYDATADRWLEIKYSDLN